MPKSASTTGGPIASSAERDGEREAGDRQHRDADRAAKLVAARRRLEAGEVRQQRGLDRLEELQRRARDQQDVEHDAGQRGIGAVRLDGQHRRR